jgi:hypothetical protein
VALQGRIGHAFAWTDNGKDYWLLDGAGWWAWRDGDWLDSAKVTQLICGTFG